MWPDVLNTLSRLKRATWSLIAQNAQVIEYDGQRLVIGFATPGLAGTFGKGAHQEFLRQALIEVIGLDCKVESTVGDRPAAGRSVPAGPTPPTPPMPKSEPVRENPSPRTESRPESSPEPHRSRPEPDGWGAPPAVVDVREPAPPVDDIPPPDEPPPLDEPPPPDEPPYERSTRSAPARPEPARPQPTRSQPASRPAPQPQAHQAHQAPRVSAALDEDVSIDDPEIEGSGLVGRPVVEQLLGGRVIEERDE